MALQTVSAKPKIGNQCFNILPDVLVRHIFTFLEVDDDRRVIAIAAICGKWRRVLRKEREASLYRLRLRNVHAELIGEHPYPKEMKRLFRYCKVPIFKLPVLDLGGRWGPTEYINMIDPEDMEFPIMRFADRFGRPGIAFHLEGHAETQVEISGQQRQIRDLSGVFVVFKLFTEGGPWRVGMKEPLNSTMFFLHNDRHKKEGHTGLPTEDCPNCPSGMRLRDDISYPVLYDLLAGQDPIFRIAQGENPALPDQARGLSQRTILATTALAALALACLASYLD